jgi:hypothetical protein
MFFSTTVKSQIIRGPTGSEFFLSTEWYFDGEYTHSGLFYSNDHGQTIEVNYEYGSFPESPPSLGEVLDDAQPGVIYNKPYYYSDFMISYNNGTSWEVIEISPSYGSYCAGKVPGEIFHSGFSVEGYLLKSVDYGQSFDTINTNVKYIFSVGVNPEILYGITTIYGDPNQYILNISHDNGLTFEECLALDTSITGLYLEDIYRGANLGELYLVSCWISDHYKIYFSTDDGHTWQFRSSTIDVGIPQESGQANVENIHCYPNPVTEMLIIGNLEISSYPPGLYVAILKNDKQVFFKDKFVVVR